MTILLFIAILALLILSHEFGHFIFAKLNKVRVEEFGLGFPPRLLGFKKGETLYSLNLIPFGGFVKIYGEEGEENADKRSFGAQSFRVRATILTAGVLFNLFLAWPVLTTVFLIGAPISLDNPDISGGILEEKGVIILQVQEQTPAEKAGLRSGDYLLRFISKDNEILDISTVAEVQNFIEKNKGAEIQIEYSRSEKKLSAKAVPSLKPEAGKGSLGIMMDRVGLIKLPFFKAVVEGLKDTIRLTAIIAKALVNFFADLFTKQEMLSQVAGPVGIAGIVAGAAEAGFSHIFQLIALLSINLALINIIPFPALDGGRLLFLAAEFIKGKPISQKNANLAHNIGFAILILLMLAITYQDISKIIR